MTVYTHRCPVTGCPWVVSVTQQGRWASVPVGPYVIDHCRYVAQTGDQGLQTDMHATEARRLAAAWFGLRDAPTVPA